MQLQRLVLFHKALSDPTRIRILALLARGPLHGQALAGKLGIRPPTVTHHMSKLREAGLVKERREKNTIYFYLQETTLRRKARAVLDVVLKEAHETFEEKAEDKMKNTDQGAKAKRELEKQEVLRNFFTPEGRLKQVPAQRKKRLIVLQHIVKGLQTGTSYTEKEINEHIQKFHDDFATLRRELIVNHIMYRENGIYELNPPELWSDIP